MDSKLTHGAVGFLFFSQDEGSSYFLGQPGHYSYIVKRLDANKAVITQGTFALNDSDDLKVYIR